MTDSGTNLGSFNLDDLNDSLKEDDSKVGVFEVRTANQCIEDAKKIPKPVPMLGGLWQENEVCLLFSDTNTGKSALAVQIAEALATGESILELPNRSLPKVVLYIDFELNDKQFENRYSDNFSDHHSFGKSLYRLTVHNDIEFEDSKDFESKLMDSLEMAIKQREASVVIIDNLTFMKTETEKAKDASPLMKRLKHIKETYKLSILVLAHTPKLSEFREISLNDLAGSKALMNFTDSAIAIGKSRQDQNIRYIKQIKARSVEIDHGSWNVLVCVLTKDASFLKFQLVGNSHENEHLMVSTENEKEIQRQEVVELHRTGTTNVAIGKKLGKSEGWVRQVLKKSGIK